MMQKFTILSFCVAGLVSCGAKKKTATESPDDNETVVLTGGNTNPSTTINTDLPTNLLPAGHAFYQDISTLPVHPNSDTYIASIGANTNFHANFGTIFNNAPVGYPYSVVGANQAKVAIHFVAHPNVGNYSEPPYPDSSVPGPLPIPPNALPLAGSNGVGDRAVIVYDKDNKLLYELYRCFNNSDGSWDVLEASKFDLSGSKITSKGSLAAAGTPKLPALVRYEEVAAGAVNHAIAIAVNKSQAGFVSPAIRSAGSGKTDPSLPPMGLRLRLKASVDISGFPSDVKVILTAAKKFGFVVDDNGSSWFITGTFDMRWNDTNLATLRQLKGSDLEAVYTGDITPGF